jgi:diguanylate cyclase (GGDEF)-like protein/PAS domain S-box-containing protein
VTTTDRPPVRDLPEGTYVELVSSLCGTRMPAVVMTILFIIVGSLSVRASSDHALAALVATGGIVSAARLVVLFYGRRICDRAEMSPDSARRFERQFALSYCGFAAIFGAFAARAYMLPPAEWQMPIGILVVGYAAGAASTVAMRPCIVGWSLAFSVIPPTCILLLRENTNALLSSVCLLALLAGGLRSARQRYRSQRAKTTTRQVLARQAQTDHLTGLGNRLALAHTFATNSEDVRPGRVALHYVDLDEFKPVNDQFGHHVGDRLLCLVGERLKACCSPGDVAVRLGGDEFVLAQLDTTSENDVEQLAARIEHSLNLPYILGGRSIKVGASIGSSRHSTRAQTLDALLIAADTALSRKKAERHAVRKLVVRPAAFETHGATDPSFSVNVTRDGTQERARLLVDGIALAFWETAPDGLIETDSLSWRTYTGQSYDDWKGYGWVTAIHPDDRVATVRMWHDTVHDQQSVEAQYRLKRWDGTYRWMQVHAVPLRDSDGSIVRWLGMNIDIDDRRRAGL